MSKKYITAKDFKEQLGKLGYVVYEDGDYIHVQHDPYDDYSVVIYKFGKYQMDSIQQDFIHEKAFDLIIRFLRTPVEFRFPKYALKIPYSNKVLAYSSELNEFRFYNKHGEPRESFKTIFTEREMIDMPNQAFVYSLERVEVK